MGILPLGLQDFGPSRCEQSALPAGPATERNDFTEHGGPGRRLRAGTLILRINLGVLVIRRLCSHSQIYGFFHTLGPLRLIHTLRNDSQTKTTFMLSRLSFRSLFRWTSIL
jgi:hypothetical protein